MIERGIIPISKTHDWHGCALPGVIAPSAAQLPPLPLIRSESTTPYAVPGFDSQTRSLPACRLLLQCCTQLLLHRPPSRSGSHSSPVTGQYKSPEPLHFASSLRRTRPAEEHPHPASSSTRSSVLVIPITPMHSLASPCQPWRFQFRLLSGSCDVAEWDGASCDVGWKLLAQ